MLAEPVRRDLFLLVERYGDAVSRDDASRALGITRSLAAFHLDKLVDAGLLDAHFRRLSGRSGPGAGRPSKLYRPSRRPIEISFPPREYELLARLLAERLEGEGGFDFDPSAVGNARHHGRALGERARGNLRSGATPKRVRQCLGRLLAALGYQPKHVAGDGEITFGNCPFHSVAREHTATVCQMNLALVSGIVEGVGAKDLHADRADQRGECCVAIREAASS